MSCEVRLRSLAGFKPSWWLSKRSRIDGERASGVDPSTIFYADPEQHFGLKANNVQVGREQSAFADTVIFRLSVG